VSCGNAFDRHPVDFLGGECSNETLFTLTSCIARATLPVGSAADPELRRRRHYCVGANPARLEIAEVLKTVTFHHHVGSFAASTRSMTGTSSGVTHGWARPGRQHSLRA
jgi:hypothetical protein